jgi:outer membrane protein assembly factor BamA
VTRPGLLGPQSRVSVPLTWGGERRVGVQAERTFAAGPLRRIEAGASLTRRNHPFYRVADWRRRLGVHADTRTVHGLRGDVSGAWEDVRFGDRPDRLVRLGAGVTLDTRVDPVLARNAVLARLASERLWSRESGGLTTSVVDLRGYVGLYGQSVLVVRAYRDGASGPRPAFERRMIGGYEVLRGVRFGRAVGDTLSAGSLELRTPVTSPLSFARLGVSVFVDAAAVYDEGQRLADQQFERGIGGGVWLSAALVRVNLAVARGLGHSTRIHLATSLLF